ncbi:MAG: polysaccharide deacetylase family protein [Ruminococcus sp.]|nr:polysaccharide deacetylase family protein [Ruminococcus sp.]
MNSQINVLYYHRVYAMEDDINLLCVTPARFEQQIRYLKRNYNILRFEEDWNNCDGKGVVITFDDGYLDNYQYALPILEKLQVPATVFVSTGVIENNRGFWWDELDRLILHGSNALGIVNISDEKFGCCWDISTYDLRLNCYYAIHYLMKNFIDVETREQWFRQLRKQQKLDCQTWDVFKTLDKHSCMELAGSQYITIGAHATSHMPLAKMSEKEQRDEIVNSKDYLETLLGRKVDIFSYPFGGRGGDYSEKTVQICKQWGIKKAATTTPGIWTPKCSNYEIPRNVVRNWKIAEFQYMIDQYWKINTQK